MISAGIFSRTALPINHKTYRHLQEEIELRNFCHLPFRNLEIWQTVIS